MSLTLKFKYDAANIPVDADPVIAEIFYFYITDPASRGLSKDEFDKKDLHYWELLKEKMKEDPVDAFSVMVCSVASFQRKKFETALFLIVRSMLMDPSNTFAYRLLIQYIKAFNYGDLEPMYVAHAANGFEPLIDYLLGFAKTHFEKDELIKSDFYIQRAICLYSVDSSQPDFFRTVQEETRGYIENGTYEQKADELIINQRDVIEFENPKAVKRFTDRWLDDPNKKALSELTARLLSGNKTCVELGCHSGALLSMIKERCKGNPKFIGIDPDKKALELGKKKFKDIRFIHGDDSDLVEGRVDLPEKFDVLLLSDICLLLRPEILSPVFAFAKDRCKHIVIMDDIVNTFGDFSVFRRVYFLHPYKKMLEENGFKIIDKSFLPKPNWANSGILTAKKI
jgi:SAM-dependent methyltransferase